MSVRTHALAFTHSFPPHTHRMSTIFAREDGSMVMYTKGADSVICERADPATSTNVMVCSCALVWLVTGLFVRI